MSRRKRTKTALARAERLLDRAESLGLEAVEVLCVPAVRRAARKAERAAELVEQAMALAGPPALARLGLRGRQTWLLPSTFVDEASWNLVKRLGYELGAGGEYAFGERLAIPDRRYFREQLVERSRAALADLAHIAGLAEGSAELRALRATVKERRRRRGGA